MFHPWSRPLAPLSPPSPFASAPSDLLLEIAQWFDCRQDLVNFCFTSKHIFAIVSAVLYQSVTLNTVEQCSSTLAMLRQHPSLARHIQVLHVRLPKRWVTSVSVEENEHVSATVRSLAASKGLDALVKFIWDAEEIPFNEDMWFALRIGCPRLKYIGTSIGARLPASNSHLFDFANLSGFFLHFRSAFYDSYVTFFEDDEPIIQKLWSLIIDNSPNLEELVIEGTSPIPVHTQVLASGRWPKLRKLILGDVSADWPLDPGEKRPFVTFLESHKNLRDLGISKHTILPNHLASVDPTIHQLTSFTGTHQQLQVIPHLFKTLKSVTFREPVETREVSAPTVVNLLRELTSLTNLNISFSLNSMYDSSNLLRSLTQSCPHLRHLALTCAQKPSFQLYAFAKGIQGFPKLRSLHLTIVKYPGDEALAAGAARIAKSNPRLKQFCLTFIPPMYPLSLPVSIPFRARATGSFTLQTDNHGLPLNLLARESSRMVWPLGLGVSSRTKQYVRDLRPGSHSRREKGIRGVWSLLFEDTQAGEEIRMFLFSGVLVGLAVWGFFVLGHTRQIGASRELASAAVSTSDTPPMSA